MTMQRRAVLIAGAMCTTAVLAQWGDYRRSAIGSEPSISLEGLVPDSFGEWSVDPLARDIVRPAAQQGDGKLFGIYDRVLERTYVDAQGYRVMLSAAYGADQSSGMQLHRPEVCYRFAGYQVDAATPVQLTLADTLVPATILQTRLPGRPEPVLYWTVFGGVAAREPSEIRWERLRLALQGRQLAGMLVRVSSVDPDPQRALAHQQAFADAMVRAVDPVRRGEVIGRGIGA